MAQSSCANYSDDAYQHTLNSFPPSPTRLTARHSRYHSRDKPPTLHEEEQRPASAATSHNTAVTSSAETSPQSLHHARTRPVQLTPTRRPSHARPTLASRRSQSSPTGAIPRLASIPSYSRASHSSERHSPTRFRSRLNSLSVMLEASTGPLQRSVSYGAVGLSGSSSSVSISGPQSAQLVYQHIVETASKRMQTLEYLRKSHEGRVYWFNTLLYSKSELLKLPYFSPQKLARRAQNYLLLGFSLPMILDLNSQTPNEYLKALGALMAEFEQYQSMHPPDGSASSSLSRARIPSMFKRATGTSTKSRRMTDASLSNLSTHSSGGDGADALSPGGSSSDANASNSLLAASLPPPVPSLPVSSSSEPLLPTEQYTHLLTPPLPFDPDFFETFATLCDVLIDCYARVTQLVSGPDVCAAHGSGLGELFAKVDARVRKVIVNGVVREFEERSRDGVKGEIAGVGKVILGGLV